MARLSDDEIERRLTGTQWRREDDALLRDVECTDFRAAMALANGVADAAEEANHHPDILIHDYKHVAITLSTHSEGGVTGNDIALAQTIDEIEL